MPRGDGKKYGEPRKRFKTGEPPQKPSKRLQARVDSYEGRGGNSPDLRGNPGYKKPGSQNSKK